MLKILLPVLLALFGLGMGLGAGLFLRADGAVAPEADTSAEGAGAEAEGKTPDAEAPAEDTEGKSRVEAKGEVEYVRFNNQFVIPVVERGQVAAMVVLALSLEVTQGQTERVYQMEPKLRDALLHVMFDHANSGGFSGDFTDGAALEPLRAALREAVVRTFGPEARDVLISDIMRQDN
jgi:3-oxoacyl-(acyl-carrier-protein) synthase